MTITATLEQPVGTKTSLSSERQVLWSVGDQIRIYNSDTPAGVIYTLADGEGTTAGKFQGDPLTGQGPYYAIYPASAGGKSATINVNVVVPATGVSLNQAHLDMTKGQEVTLEATVIPENANYRTVTRSSSNEDVATVSTSGKVKAVGGGNATITATTHNGFTTTLP